MWNRFGFVGLWGYSTKISHKAARAKSKFPHQWAEKSNLEQFRKCGRNIPESVRGQKLQRSKMITKKTCVLKDSWFLYIKINGRNQELGEWLCIGEGDQPVCIVPAFSVSPWVQILYFASVTCVLNLYTCVLLHFYILVFLYFYLERRVCRDFRDLSGSPDNVNISSLSTYAYNVDVPIIMMIIADSKSF